MMALYLRVCGYLVESGRCYLRLGFDGSHVVR